MARVTLNIPDRMLTVIDRQVRERRAHSEVGINRSSLIREALVFWMDQEGTNAREIFDEAFAEGKAQAYWEHREELAAEREE